MLRTVQLATRATALLQVGTSSSSLHFTRQLHISRLASSEASDLASSRAAYEQRKLLEALRPTKASSASSVSSSNGRPATSESLASAALDVRARAGAGGMPGLMGLGQGAGYGGGKWDRAAGGGKKWGTLTGKEKVVRAGLNSGRLTLVLIGGTLTLAIVWAASFEVLSRNSPTKIYSDACKRIKESPELYEHLLPPLRFSPIRYSMTTSASPFNPRSQVQQQQYVVVPASSPEAHDVMLLRFTLTSREAGKDWTLVQTVREGITDAARWSKDMLLDGVDMAREWIQGEEFEPVRQRGATFSPWSTPASSRKEEEERREPKKKGWLAATFGGLSRITPDAITRTKREPGTWSSGEVHAELERDDDGILQYKSLYVDIPNTQAAMRQRVWIIRKKGEVKR